MLMAPSRGFALFPSKTLTSIICRVRCQSSLAQIATDSARRTQVYISRTLDPYLNLSIEHFLLQKTPPESTILFLYTNRPCIVIGRNQNPWVEVNLGLLNYPEGLGAPNIKSVSLVRRRSGGGAVFHDEGNVNYSVICPTTAFDRDKHAQMVVRTLKKLGATKAKVNERHDIVLEPDSEQDLMSADGLAKAVIKPLKVSGSAYKLTRLRSLHHGTCLLSSPNIHQISRFLRSPAKPYIKARGVDSVSSPIANVNVSSEAFEKGVVAEFCRMYNFMDPITLTDEVIEVPEIAKGLDEMKSLEWTYAQTPQFTFSSHETSDDPRERPPLPDYLPSGVALSFTARNGTIIEGELTVPKRGNYTAEEMITLDISKMMQRKVHTIDDWQDVLPRPTIDNDFGISKWLNELFGKRLDSSHVKSDSLP